MTILELNLGIATLVYPTSIWYKYPVNGSSSVTNGNGCILDYCEVWESLMPLVVEHSEKINRAMQKRRDYEFWIYLDDETQRSLAEYLLEALQEEDDAN